MEQQGKQKQFLFSKCTSPWRVKIDLPEKMVRGTLLGAERIGKIGEFCLDREVEGKCDLNLEGWRVNDPQSLVEVAGSHWDFFFFQRFHFLEKTCKLE